MVRGRHSSSQASAGMTNGSSGCLDEAVFFVVDAFSVGSEDVDPALFFTCATEEEVTSRLSLVAGAGIEASVADRFSPRLACDGVASDALAADLNEVAMDLTGVADRDRVSTIPSTSLGGRDVATRIDCRHLPDGVTHDGCQVESVKLSQWSRPRNS